MDSPGPGPGPESKPRPEPAPNSVSLKSDRSKEWPVYFKSADTEDQDLLNMDSPGPGPESKPRPEPAPSSVSLKSDWSKDLPINFKSADTEDQDFLNVDPPGSGSRSKPRPKPAPSSMSLKSDRSKSYPPDFAESNPKDQRVPGPKEQLDVIFSRLEEDILTFVKEQLQSFYKLLATEYPDSSSESEEQQRSRKAVLNITVDFLRRMKQGPLAERLRNRSSVGIYRYKQKSHLQQRFSSVFEGVTKAGSHAPFQQIFTELHLTQGGASEVSQEHEVRHIESASRKLTTEETTITCEDIFKKRPVHKQRPIRTELSEQSSSKKEKKKPKRRARTVLTKGVAGIGKTVLTQKFSLDWAEGRANQDVQLLFPFTFRELNVLRGTEFSLAGLLHHFFSQTKGLCSFENIHIVFILDGLDECRLPLDFSRTRVLTEPTECAPVEVLLVNLIRGSLLPSARLWITTRPAAAGQIPAEYVSMVTEVRGFTDQQKEQYFRKRFRDEQQATAIIAHIKSIHSLYEMCYIPVFCWILSTILLHLMKTRAIEELPRTLTQMYIHFLVVQAKVKNIKYHGASGADLHWTPETREMVWSLGKLAFEQLQKGNLIFYESDLSECGLDAAEASVYSGVFTQVFREEQGLYQDKVYCFIHLSVQEFLAALHVHQTFVSSGINLLSTSHSSEIPQSTRTCSSEQSSKQTVLKIFHKKETKSTQTTPDTERPDPEAFYRSAVDQALQSPNGHLDLLLRFVLGLSMPTNQRLLHGLLTHTQNSSQTFEGTIKYIKQKLDEGVSAEKSLNLLHCLMELNDRSLVEKIQGCMRKGSLSCVQSPAQWSALCFLLLSSDLEEFDLRKYHNTETAVVGLLPVIKASTKAILAQCGLSSLSCGPLASVLSSSSSLTHLDLSNNDLQDSGVEMLCEGLKSAPCSLQTLRLSGCLVSERGGASLASALSSVFLDLRELDLSYNHPGPSAELLSALRAPHGPLHSLRLDPAGEQWMVPGLRKYSCEVSLDPNTAHRNLLLSEDKQTVSNVEEEQPCPDHEDRFTDLPQVLSSAALRGRCYWEVEWSGWWVEIGVSYRDIRRKGDSEECWFGNNDQSWSLRICDGHYSVCHMKTETKIVSCSSSPSSGSGRVAVFLDSEAGALSFYVVHSDGKLFHLHTFCCAFTKPLFPGFGVFYQQSSVSVADVRKPPLGQSVSTCFS